MLTTHEKNGQEVVPRQNVHIRFTDGGTWNTIFFGPADDAEMERFLDFLRGKTGKPIIRTRLIKDVPGW